MSAKSPSDVAEGRSEKQSLSLYVGAAVVLGGVAAYALGGRFLLRDMRGLSKEATRVMHDVRPVRATRVNTIHVNADHAASASASSASHATAPPLMGDPLSRRVADKIEGAAAARVRATDPGNEAFPPSTDGRMPAAAAADDDDDEDFGEWSKETDKEKSKHHSKQPGGGPAAQASAAATAAGRDAPLQ